MANLRMKWGLAGRFSKAQDSLPTEERNNG